ncbi:penicillin-binding transpeptidase domain-containing protein [Streptomyces sp. NPDC057654]|uniref:penicillin-binding transpeptidase domain-containing protein n=1 Tax=Streptomyces sp. NPDC057654 TaxID=3346196 RepID=UPI0036A76AC5
MRTGVKIAVGGTIAVVVGVAGYGAYNMIDGISDSSTAAHSESAGRTGPPSADEIREAAKGFLDAWADGDPEKAADFTDNAGAAVTALTGYREDAHVKKVSFKPGTAEGSKVPFAVTAEVSSGEHHATWTYDSALTVHRGKNSGRALVDWKPAVMHPKLKVGQHLTTGGSHPQITAVDRHGKELNDKDYPSLVAVLPQLRAKFGDKTGGEAGVEVSVEPDGQHTPGPVLFTVSKGKPGKLQTTLDAAAQRAAEKAVKAQKEASVVAVQPSTGGILAIANSKKTAFNPALMGQTAPGSTMKVITAATLLEKGKASPGKALPCPKYETYGMKFHNVEGAANPGATFAQDFAASCNTAFISLAKDIPDDAVAGVAKDVFGIGLDWKTGLSTFDGSVPADTGAGKAAAMIGQGRVQMNPLTMASVAATARTGSFHQPYVVAPSVDDRELAKAARSLPGPVAKDLRSMMKLTATQGTGQGAMAGLGSDVGAKTGSAEVDNQTRSNGWFTAYRGDVAAAAVVPRGGHGGDSAGPIVAAVLRAK